MLTRIPSVLALCVLAAMSPSPRGGSAYDGLLITEISIQPIEQEGVEISNTNTEGVIDLSGVIITDRQGSATIEGQAEFPPGTMIAAGESIWVFTSVSTLFIPDTSIIPPGTQIFEDGESGAEFEGKPIPNMVNRVNNVSLSDLGDDLSLLAPGTERPIIPGVNGDAVIDAVYAGATTFIGTAFLMGPDSPRQPGDIGLTPPMGLSLQRLPHSQDTDRMIADAVLSDLTPGRPMTVEPITLEPSDSVLVADMDGFGHLTAVTGLHSSPEIVGRVVTRGLATEGEISPDGDTAVLLDAQRSILTVIEGLTSGLPRETSLFTPFDDTGSSLPTGVHITADGTRAVVASLIDANLTAIRGLPRNPTVAGRVAMPLGEGPDDFALSPTDPEIAVATQNGLGMAAVIRGLTTREPEIIPLTVMLNPNGVLITPSGQRAIVCNSGSDSITVIDDLTGTPHVSATLASPDGVGSAPQGIAISPVGDVALVTNSFGDTVTVLTDLDGEVPRIAATVPVGFFPAGVAFLPDGATAIVGTAGSPGIDVISNLLPDPRKAQHLARLTDPRLDVATFSEQSILTFPPEPFETLRETFDEGDAGWHFAAAVPDFTAPVPDSGGGALSLTSLSVGDTYGGWSSPPGVVPLTGASLHAMRMELATDQPDRTLVPSARMRFATFDGSLETTATFSSHWGAEAAPGTVASPYWVALALPPDPDTGLTPPAEGGGGLAWDLIHFDVFDPAPVTLRIEEVAVTRRSLLGLGTPVPAASFDFSDGPQGWWFSTVEPHFRGAIGYEEPGRLITQVVGTGDEVGFWTSPLITDLPTDRLLRFRWRLATDITPQTKVPTVRLRVFTEDFQVLVEGFVRSVGEALHSPGPSPRTLDLFVVFPRRMGESGAATVHMVAAFDVIGLDPTDAGGALWLESMELDLLPLPVELN